MKSEKYDIGEYSVEKIYSWPAHRFIASSIKHNSRVLEIGPSTGFITRYLKEEKKCDVTCIELDPYCAEKCKPYSENVIIADIQGNGWMDKIEGLFDYITFGDVLEHLHNPGETLKKVILFLKPTGVILSSIPNISHNSIIINLIKGIFDYKNNGLLDNTHVYFFTRKSIDSMFDSADLVCINESYYICTPSRTEFYHSYWHALLIAPFLALRKDGHVYQFFHIWAKKQESHESAIDIMNTKRPQSILQAARSMMNDLLETICVRHPDRHG